MRIGYGYCFIDLDFKGEKMKTDPLVRLSLTLKQAILFKMFFFEFLEFFQDTFVVVVVGTIIER